MPQGGGEATPALRRTSGRGLRVYIPMLDRIVSALVALSLAFLVWLYARSRDQEILDNVPIPVKLSLAAGQADQYDLEVTGPPQVPVSFSGPPVRVRELRGLLQRGEVRIEYTVAVPD